MVPCRMSFIPPRERIMIFAGDWRRQAHVCARLAEDCEDQHLAERLKLMAADLDAKADEVEDSPTKRLKYIKPPLAA
jgi:hypothetical protein